MASLANEFYHKSIEYVRLRVPDGATSAEMTFTDGSDPDPLSYEDAELVPGEARILIGPGTTTGELAKGRWKVWLKLTANPEIPQKPAGWITIT